MFKRSLVFHGVLPLLLSTSLVYHSCPQSKLSDLSSLSTNVFSITHRCQPTSLLKTTISEALISNHHTATTMRKNSINKTSHVSSCAIRRFWQRFQTLVCVGSLLPSTGDSTCKPCDHPGLQQQQQKKHTYTCQKNTIR